MLIQTQRLIDLLIPIQTLILIDLLTLKPQMLILIGLLMLKDSDAILTRC